MIPYTTVTFTDVTHDGIVRQKHKSDYVYLLNARHCTPSVYFDRDEAEDVLSCVRKYIPASVSRMKREKWGLGRLLTGWSGMRLSHQKIWTIF